MHNDIYFYLFMSFTNLRHFLQCPAKVQYTCHLPHQSLAVSESTDKKAMLNRSIDNTTAWFCGGVANGHPRQPTRLNVGQI